tara:strand:- start:149 stop:412 length:264 start_codon:yes stop_codon:yes gene_type:complete
MTTITIQEGDGKPMTLRVFGPFDANAEPGRWFAGKPEHWQQCERCLDIYHYEEANAPDDSCECGPCRRPDPDAAYEADRERRDEEGD